MWAEREFGAAHADENAELVTRYTQYNGRRKPELLDIDMFSLMNYREADRVEADWKALLNRPKRCRSYCHKSSRMLTSNWFCIRSRLQRS